MVAHIAGDPRAAPEHRLKMKCGCLIVFRKSDNYQMPSMVTCEKHHMDLDGREAAIAQARNKLRGLLGLNQLAKKTAKKS